MNKPNPLQTFFRKPKFSIWLPSRGRWHPVNSLKSTDGRIEIFSMTAADETKFKTNEVLLSAQATYDLIQSCAPAIQDPENMPIVDLDAVLLSIRRATYTDTMQFTAAVPGTSLADQFDLSIEALVNGLADVSQIWDEELIIQEGENQVTFQLAPLNLKSLFNATRYIMKQQHRSETTANSQADPDEKLQEITQQLKTIAAFAVTTIADSVRSVKTNTGYETQNLAEIRDLITQLDLEYFRALKAHLEIQKKNAGFQTVTRTATAEMLAAGAPETYPVEIAFNLNNFFS